MSDYSNARHKPGQKPYENLKIQVQFDKKTQIPTYYASGSAYIAYVDLKMSLNFLQKLEYYGIRGGELNLFKSFLTNRRQYVEIDGIKSDILESLNCSTIQGSKLSCILYIIYVNEVTALNKIMDTCYYQIMTLKEQISIYMSKLRNVFPVRNDFI